MAKQTMWAPWRIGYVRTLQPEAGDEVPVTGPSKADPASISPDEAEDGGCFLCQALADNSQKQDDSLILTRDERGVLMLNRYPYTNGHLLAAPEAHVSSLAALSEPQRSALMSLSNLAAEVLERGLGAQGANLGMNLGQCAGAGLPGHLHMHIVPRWYGDVNFMDVTGGVRVVPESLTQTAATLRATIERMS